MCRFKAVNEKHQYLNLIIFSMLTCCSVFLLPKCVNESYIYDFPKVIVSVILPSGRCLIRRTSALRYDNRLVKIGGKSRFPVNSQLVISDALARPKRQTDPRLKVDPC